MPWPSHVNYDGHPHQDHIQDESEPPDVLLGFGYLQIPQDIYPHQQTRYGAAQMCEYPYGSVHVQEVPVVNGLAKVAQHDYAVHGDLDVREHHLAPVLEKHVGGGKKKKYPKLLGNITNVIVYFALLDRPTQIIFLVHVSSE